jgi:hypothetical protein
VPESRKTHCEVINPAPARAATGRLRTGAPLIDEVDPKVKSNDAITSLPTCKYLEACVPLPATILVRVGVKEVQTLKNGAKAISLLTRIF